jgi:ribosomal protein S4
VSVPGYIVKRDEEPKIKYFTQSPIAKSDHPVRKIAAAGAAAQEVTASKPA